MYYLIEKSVLEATLSEHLPALAWTIFSDGPLVREEGIPVTVARKDWILFDFEEFELLLPPYAVTIIEEFEETC